MAGLIRARAGPGSLLPVRRSSTARPPPAAASRVGVRFASPLFLSAKVCKSRGLVAAAALEVSKDGSSAVLANRQPSKGCSFFFSYPEAFQRLFRIECSAADQVWI